MRRVLLAFCFYSVSCGAAVAADQSAGAAAREDLLRTAISLACRSPALAMLEMADALSSVGEGEQSPIQQRGRKFGWRRRFEVSDGARLLVERIAPGDTLRRVNVSLETSIGGELRPSLHASATADCRIQGGRRLVYDDDGLAVELEHLDETLAPVGTRELLNPPKPRGTRVAGVRVAVVDAGVNYLLPNIANALARDFGGSALGYDYWDLDDRPFDAHPARSPFFPQRHGTRIASVIAREAPMARLVAYRYPRGNMHRMADLIDDAAKAGVRIVNLSLGGNLRAPWEVFAASAEAHPEILFVASAGNNGRDIDVQPVYPASLPLPNLITVTSAVRDDRLAIGSNWGPHSVDLLVPAEDVLVTEFDGSPRIAAGSSYAAARVSAIAACFAAAHPEWKAAELMRAVFELAVLGNGAQTTASGFIADPTGVTRGACVADRDRIQRRLSYRVELDGGGEDASYSLRPTLVMLEHNGWHVEVLRNGLHDAAEILKQCGIRIRDSMIHVLSAPPRFHYLRDATAREFTAYTAFAKPVLYFVRGSLQEDRYDAEAFGAGNTETRPELTDTIWFSSGASDLGTGIAHELFHLLADSGAHTRSSGNLMNARTDGTNTRLSDAQCEQATRVGVERGLLSAAGN